MFLKKNTLSFCYYLVLIFLLEAKCDRILGIFPMSGGSHFKMASTLMRGLAEAGNDVTIICPYEDAFFPKNGSYRSIAFLENFDNDLEEPNLFEIRDFNKFTQEAVFQNYMYEKSELLVKDPEVRKLINSKTTFDAVIVEQFSNDALKVFGHVFNGHLIVFAPIGPYNFVNRLVANPTMLAYNPQIVTTFPRPMSFKDRVLNVLLYVYEEVVNYFVFLPRQDKFIKKYFPEAPSVYDLTTNVSLVLLNSHESLWQSLPLVPNAIPIGGYHISPPKKLPKDIQNYLDSAKEGVILFSLGTNLKVSQMDSHKKEMFVNSLSKIKEKVLWKTDVDIPGLPKNIKTAQWLPQMDILAHPNVKLFLSHGGLLSMTETIYNGVPTLVIPVFGDQATNANHATKAGYGLSIVYHDLSEEKLTAALTEMLTNPAYKENALRQSKIYHDRPMKPMDTAIYWVNFVIKHGGARHLRVDGLYLSWYQYLLVDVVSFLLFIFVVFVLMIVFVLKAIFTINKAGDTKIKMH